LGNADQPSRLSAIEHRPADLVSQPLIVEDELANRSRELLVLPTTLDLAGALAVVSGGSRTGRFDGVGRSTELMGGHVRHDRRLAGSIGGVPRRAAHRSRRSHGVATGGA
jgi:hypothetical protein